MILQCGDTVLLVISYDHVDDIKVLLTLHVGDMTMCDVIAMLVTLSTVLTVLQYLLHG